MIFNALFAVLYLECTFTLNKYDIKVSTRVQGGGLATPLISHRTHRNSAKEFKSLERGSAPYEAWGNQNPDFVYIICIATSDLLCNPPLTLELCVLLLPNSRELPYS